MLFDSILKNRWFENLSNFFLCFFYYQTSIKNNNICYIGIIIIFNLKTKSSTEVWKMLLSLYPYGYFKLKLFVVRIYKETI